MTCGHGSTRSSSPTPGGIRRPKPLHRSRIIRCWGRGDAACRVADTEARVRGRFCAQPAGSAYRISGMSVEEFLGRRQVRKVQRGEVNLRCPWVFAPVSEQQHDAVPGPRRAPQAAGPFTDRVREPSGRSSRCRDWVLCRVRCVTAEARISAGGCAESHYALVVGSAPQRTLTVDFEAWCRTASPILASHEVALHGLTSQVQAEILFGLQQRCRRSVITYLYQLRLFVGSSRSPPMLGPSSASMSNSCPSMSDRWCRNCNQQYRG